MILTHELGDKAGFSEISIIVLFALWVKVLLGCRIRAGKAYAWNWHKRDAKQHLDRSRFNDTMYSRYCLPICSCFHPTSKSFRFLGYSSLSYIEYISLPFHGVLHDQVPQQVTQDPFRMYGIR